MIKLSFNDYEEKIRDLDFIDFFSKDEAIEYINSNEGENLVIGVCDEEDQMRDIDFTEYSREDAIEYLNSVEE